MLWDWGCWLLAAASSLSQLSGCGCWVVSKQKTIPIPSVEFWMDRTAWVFSWAAVQRAGVSSRGLSYQIHQDLPTSCIFNSLIPRNKVIFSALEADICFRGLHVFLEQWARIFFVERDILERVLNPSTSSCSGMEIAGQVWSKACWSSLVYLADVWWCYIIPSPWSCQGFGGLSVVGWPWGALLWEKNHFP